MHTSGLSLALVEASLEPPSTNNVTYKTNLKISQLATEAERKTSSALAAEELLRQLECPDTVTYNGVLKAYAKAGAPHEAERLLLEMRTIHQYQLARHCAWYSDNEDEALVPPPVYVMPNVRSYATAMDAWSRRGSFESAKRAHRLLDELEELYDTSRHPNCRPNNIAYNTVLSAYAKSGGSKIAAEAAEALLEYMEEQKVSDIISYNTVISAWARSGLVVGGKQAEALLRKIPERLTPNTRTYTTVLDAWSRCARDIPGAAGRALALLEEMEETDGLHPNCISYSTVIHAYALSREPDKAERAWQLLQHMWKVSETNPEATPSIITYNSVLNACATDTSWSSASSTSDLVRSLYKELLYSDHPNLRPDHFTYGTVLKACANVNCGESDNPQFVREVFEQCCKDGQVSFGVCYQLRQAATAELYRKLIPPSAYNPTNGHFSLKDMPREWTRNVQERRKGSKRNQTRDS